MPKDDEWIGPEYRVWRLFFVDEIGDHAIELKGWAHTVAQKGAGID